MNKIIYLIGSFLLFYFVLTAKDKFTVQHNVIYVEIVNEKFMDTLFSIITSDSFSRIINTEIDNNIDIKNLFNHRDIYITSQQYISLPEEQQHNNNKLLTDTLKKILKKDSITEILVQYTFGKWNAYKYYTIFKNKTIYFREKIIVDNEPIFKSTKRSKQMDVTLFTFNQNFTIPFVYYDGNFHLVADTMHYFYLPYE